MSASCALRCAFLSLAVFAGSVIAASAQGVGAIAGTVTDASGAVLPGATVTLTSAQGTVGGNREVLTDERGAYQFLAARPWHLQRQSRASGIQALHASRHHRELRSDVARGRAARNRHDGRRHRRQRRSAAARHVVGVEADGAHAGSARVAAQPHGRVGDHARDSEHHRQQG